MRPFSPGELTRLRSTQESAMMDTCKILAYSAGSRSDLGSYPGPVYTPGAALACGYTPGGRELELDDKTLLVTDGALRLPIGTTVAHHDRVQLTHRHGEALANPLTFEIVGPIKRGPSGLMIDLRLAEV